jgi:hypothetical protein
VLEAANTLTDIYRAEEMQPEAEPLSGGERTCAHVSFRAGFCRSLLGRSGQIAVHGVESLVLAGNVVHALRNELAKTSRAREEEHA